MGLTTTLTVLSSALITTSWTTALMIVVAAFVAGFATASLRRHLRITRRFNAIPFDARVTGPILLS
ncbi:hypothetical protein [Microvirga arabica]|uniref:hypothetical protein n=1 Tax=Microvirga arabica TaxID=1128671 RepID=UPI001939CAB8|nr:hypothetical protein [Microvirga arabica]MBM1172005.1 hypothetical protein [Microvirga arabica]